MLEESNKILAMNRELFLSNQKLLAENQDLKKALNKTL
jgi:hypothetical protein